MDEEWLKDAKKLRELAETFCNMKANELELIGESRKEFNRACSNLVLRSKRLPEDALLENLGFASNVGSHYTTERTVELPKKMEFPSKERKKNFDQILKLLQKDHDDFERKSSVSLVTDEMVSKILDASCIEELERQKREILDKLKGREIFEYEYYFLLDLLKNKGKNMDEDRECATF